METLQKDDDDLEKKEREETNYSCPLYSPCYFFQQIFKAFFKCFGHDTDHYDSNIAPNQSQTQTEITQGNFFVVSLRRATRRPPRSGLGSGSGGQTN
ncbi:hypothetical protein L484_020071 [Morus notabilis]|uniref:Uncharacterized protein n=1 Tax=Morus notabilis TaxID=981085 RepID=W9RBB2_9ROSA|nr:hypothetical protein L484_020071 [Morus notabilis]